MKHIINILVLIFVFQIGFGQKNKEDRMTEAPQAPVSSSQTVTKYKVKLNRETKEVISNNNTEAQRDELEQSSMSSFDYQYLKYINSPADNKDYLALQKAYELAPNNREVQFEMTKYYELKNDVFNKKELCKKLRTTLSPELKEYAYNVLMSVEENGILITYGENDTYPIWILQELENLRKDVKVLNYDLLVNANYRKQQREKLGVKFSKKYNENIDVLEDIAIKNSSKKIYFSLTVSHLVLKKLKGNLYSTGLALKYSQISYNNTNTLKNNWENKFKTKELHSSTKTKTGTKIELNYLLALIQLSKYYKSNKLLAEYEEVKQIAIAIAKRNGKESQVTNFFN